MRTLRSFSIVGCALAVGIATSAALAQYDPPASYYNSATGTGLTLKSQLHNIIDDHTIRDY
ncbi:MAG: ribonuclease, partial [Planctomycetota bacterium]